MPWLKSEFGWSIPTAERFIRVYENIKLVNLTNLSIDVSALYLIASPSTAEHSGQGVDRLNDFGSTLFRMIGCCGARR
ncbi:hypothetical protein [Acidobacterium sp. S8]|uniref:hypothetical protein n=1 Tax=Acidobacterium sp. S8 TaxID=1641854 RepID=UPI00352DAB66